MDIISGTATARSVIFFPFWKVIGSAELRSKDGNFVDMNGRELQKVTLNKKKGLSGPEGENEGQGPEKLLGG